MSELLASLKSVAVEIRLRLLLLLMKKEACVCELMSVFDMAQSKLSHHLIMLRGAGLLQDEKRGKWNYYRVNSNALNRMNRELLIFLSRSLSDGHVIEKDIKTLERVQEQMQICCS